MLDPRREGKITSSILAACLGMDTMKTPRQAWREIMGLRSFSGNKATERGNALEEVVCKYPETIYDTWKYRPAPFRQHPDHDWVGDSADALYYDIGISADESKSLFAVGDAKTAAQGMRQKWGDPGTDEVPQSVLYQCHWHLAHWPEVDRCVVPVLFGGYAFEFQMYFVDRDEELQKLVFEQAEEFYRKFVATGEEPPALAGDEEDVRNEHKGRDGLDIIQADTAIDQLARLLIDVRESKKKCEERERLLKARLTEMVQGHDGAYGDWGRFALKERAGSVSWKRVATELGAAEELIEKHRGKTSTVFDIKEK
jgi:predicted phage-related endonuclease